MRFIICFIVMTVMCCQVSAGEIAAIVNDFPISEFDVTARANLIQLQRGGQGTVSADLKKQALADLIDERIKIQEAAKQGVSPSEADIGQALSHLERQNGLASGSFQKMLAEKNIPFDTMKAQITADLGWMRVLQKSGRTAVISDAEIRAREKMIRQELSKESLRFAEIVVPTEEKALSLWQKLQEGADFRELAETESTADSRTVGGQVVGADRLYYGVAAAPVLGQMRPGQLSRPIAVKGGYALVLMLEKREAITSDTVTVWELSQAVVPPESIAATLLKQPVIGGCDAFGEAVKDDAVAQSFQRGQVAPNQLPPEVQGLLSDAPFKAVVGPVQTPAGLLYFMKCGSVERRIIPSRDDLKRQIEMEKAELESKQKLAEIKREAVIEYK